MRTVRLVETTVLLLVGVLLAVATVYDLWLDTHNNHRLIADELTWRSYTGHDYHTLGIDRQLLGTASAREVICGNTTPGPPEGRTQLCLVIYGPIVNGKRTVHGGWYVGAYKPDSLANRFGCFGPAGLGRCPVAAARQPPVRRQ